MPLIILDGPEKAGKSTIAQAIVEGRNGRVRHWGPVEPDDRVYAAALAEDARDVWANGTTVVWDRGWPAEHIYANMLNRDRRLAHDSFLGEWLYGRAFQTLGARAIILGPSVDSLMRLRNGSDLPVDPREEFMRFFEYGRQYRWSVFLQQHTDYSLRTTAETIYTQAMENFVRAQACPPHWCGPNKPVIAYVAQARDDMKFPGAWLPFTGAATIEFARMAPRPFEAAWAQAFEFPPQVLRSVQTIVTLGDRATSWVRNHVALKEQRIISMAHPAFALRYNTKSAQQAKKKMLTALARLANPGGTTATNALL